MRFPKTQVIVLANQKGGCGKTTHSISIAAAFASLGYNACLVDVDPQCNATGSFGIDPEDLIREGKMTLADAFIQKVPCKNIRAHFGERFEGNLSLVPGNRGMNTVYSKLELEIQSSIASGSIAEIEQEDLRAEHRLRLKRSIDSLRGLHDVVIIDTPPQLDFLMMSALIAADWFIVPVFSSRYDLDGLQLLMRTISKIQQKFNTALRPAGVLLGNFDRSTSLDREVHELLKNKFKQYGDQIVFNTTISRTVKHREATVRCKTIFELEDAAPHAQQYTDLVREMLNRSSKYTSNPLPDETILSKVVNG